MKLHFFAAFLLAAAPALAQQPPAPLPVVPPAVASLREAALQDELAWDGTYYFDLHHTPDDTLDKIDREALRQNVAAWTTMLAILAGTIEPEPKRGERR